jgi:hypothetical protein
MLYFIINVGNLKLITLKLLKLYILILPFNTFLSFLTLLQSYIDDNKIEYYSFQILVLFFYIDSQIFEEGISIFIVNIFI